MLNQITICCLKPELEEKAQAIAKKYHFQFVDYNKIQTTRFQLQLSHQFLQLVDVNQPKLKPLQISFISGKAAHRKQFGGGKTQLIAKAFGLNKGFKPEVIDATAGLAGDSFVLTCLGCRVTLLERSSIMASILEYAIEQASDDESLIDEASRMKLIHEDSIKFLCRKDFNQQVDIIYLDPMFPEKKGSALVKKEMQYLQELVGEDLDSGQLLSCAIKQAKYRVVVKRPIKSPFLDQQKPQLQLSSKKQRFDIYINQGLPRY